MLPCLMGIIGGLTRFRFRPVDQAVIRAEYLDGLSLGDRWPPGECDDTINTLLLEGPNIVIAAKTLVSEENVTALKSVP